MEIFTLILTTFFLLILSILYLKHLKNIKFFEENGLFYLGHSATRFRTTIFGTKLPPAQLLDTYSEIKKKSKVGVGVVKGFKGHQYLICDLDLMKDIFVKGIDHFTDRFHLEETGADPITPRFLSSIRGQRWKVTRAKVTPAFTSKRIKAMMDKFNESGRKLVGYIRGQSEKGPLEAYATLSKYTMDITASAGFGVDSKAFDPENCEPGKVSEFEEMGTSFMFEGFLDGLRLSLIFSLPKVMKFFNISLFKNEAISYFQKVVKDVLAYRSKEGSSNRSDFLAIILQAKEKLLKLNEGYEVDDSGFVQDDFVEAKGNLSEYDKMDDLDVIAHCILFIMAGYDTVMSLNVAVMHVLSVLPEIQEKVYQDIQQAMGEEEEITAEAIEKMTYLDKFLKETLRYFPPGMLIHRKCTKPYTIPGTNVRINLGDVVTGPIFAVHRDEKVFKDQGKFDPERFSKESITSIPNYGFMPFGHGQRSCIGFRLGVAEAKCAIIHIIRNFRVTQPDESVKFDVELTATMTDGIRTAKPFTVQFVPRN